jgi:hypothetical protein
MTTPRALLAGILLGTMLGGPALAADGDSHGLAEAIAKKLYARHQFATSLDTTDFQGTGIGCIVMPRSELRRYRYPGHAMICEVAATGEVLGTLMNGKGRRICDPITGSFTEGTSCYAINICGNDETLCVQ